MLKKIGKTPGKNMKKKALIYRIVPLIGTAIALAFAPLNAQDVKFTATAPSAVENGKQFAIVYSINQNASDLKLPDIAHFEFLGGPQSSQSSSFSMVNGKTTQSINVSYTFYYQAVKEGTFTIPPATIKVKKETYRSNPLTIEVVKSTTQVPQQQNQQSNQQQNIANAQDLFLQIFTDKRQAYVGEQIVATVKLFSRYNIDGNEDIKLPSYKGFYKQDIETESRLQQENINGQVYLTAPLQRVILYPQQSGELTIDPASITLILRERVRSNSFFPEYRRFQKELTSNAVSINVKPLPASKPTGYSGAVGNFTLTGTVNKTEVTTNEALTFIITLKGKGNIKLIETPQLKLPTDFEVFEPKLQTNIANNIAGQSGTKTFEYLAIPRHAGNYTIEPVFFSYFDVNAQTYKTLKTPTFQIAVSKGADSIQAPMVLGVSKEELQFLGSDIRFIKTKTYLRPIGAYFVGTPAFYLAYVAILLIMALVIVVRRKQLQRNQNIWHVKNKKANKMANKRLRLAHTHLKNGNDEAFYEEMAKALWGYIGDKLSLPVSSLSKDKAMEQLAQNGVPGSTIQELVQVIEECEFARYAPPTGASAMKDSYTQAVKLISETEQKMR
jgi:hypothetical protein